MTFQLQYGAGYKKIAETLGISPQEAKDFIDAFYSKYKEVAKWHNDLADIKKYFPSPREKDAYEIMGPEYSRSPVMRGYCIKAKDDTKGGYYYPLTEMKNYPVQGFATGDLVPLVVNRIMYLLGQTPDKFELVSTVHDDFTIELSNAEDMYFVLSVIEFVFGDLKNHFKQLFDYDLKVQYNYDVKIGTDFADMQKITRKEIQDILGEIKNG